MIWEKTKLKKSKILILLCFFLVLSLIQFAHADDSNVNLLNLPTQLAAALGISVFAAGILCTIGTEMFCVIPITILTRGKNMLITVIFAFLGLGFSTAVGWLAYWLMIVIVLITAGLWASIFRNSMGGRGGD